MFVFSFVTDKRQNGRTDRAQIFCGPSHDPREGLYQYELFNPFIWTTIKK